MRLDPEIVARIGIDRAKRRGEVAAKGGGVDSTPRIHTPAPFRDLLLALARTAQPFAAPGEHGRADPLSSAPVTFDDRVSHDGGISK